MFQRGVFRLAIGMGLPIASALVVEQLPKSGVAEIPFSFEVEGRMLAAGTYAVKEADFGRSIRIQNDTPGGEVAVARAKWRFGTSNRSTLIFVEQSGRYSLAEIWFESDGPGLVLQGLSLQAGKSADGEIRYVPLR
jgi:hypothetical protein